MPGPSFQIDHVTLEVDGRIILDDVNVDIEAGVITAVVGPSGSGKSTLLRLLNRLMVPTSGQIRMDGVPLERLDVLELRRRVGMVFQRPTVFEGTVAGNLAAADPQIGSGGVARLLESVNLPPDWGEKATADLSGGEAQRVCLARTLATGPDAVLMDEATSALDVDNRIALERLTRRLVKELGLTAVWVTHDLEQVERIADRVVHIDDGRVVPS